MPGVYCFLTAETLTCMYDVWLKVFIAGGGCPPSSRTYKLRGAGGGGVL